MTQIVAHNIGGQFTGMVQGNADFLAGSWSTDQKSIEDDPGMGGFSRPVDETVIQALWQNTIYLIASLYCI